MICNNVAGGFNLAKSETRRIRRNARRKDRRQAMNIVKITMIFLIIASVLCVAGVTPVMALQKGPGVVETVFATVELAPTISTGASPSTLTRCITFEFYDCNSAPGVPAEVIEAHIKFSVETGQPTIGAASLTLENPGAYTLMTARDRLHTIRSMVVPSPAAGGPVGAYEADFTCDAALLGGDLNDDDYIDMDDYNLFMEQIEMDYGSGNTTCQTVGPHADFSGDGMVTWADYTFIQINYRPRGVEEVLVEVELSGVISTGVSPDELTRCITFELYDCDDDPNNPAEVIETEVDFSVANGQPTIGTAMLTLSNPGDYARITARDRRHTLRRAVDLPYHSAGPCHAAFKANFTGDAALLGGNLNDDEYVDILDYGVYSSEFNENYGVGDTDCQTPFPHADINGDGIVTTPDYSFIQSNFLVFSDEACVSP